MQSKRGYEMMLEGIIILRREMVNRTELKVRVVKPKNGKATGKHEVTGKIIESW